MIVMVFLPFQSHQVDVLFPPFAGMKTTACRHADAQIDWQPVVSVVTILMSQLLLESEVFISKKNVRTSFVQILFIILQ